VTAEQRRGAVRQSPLEGWRAGSPDGVALAEVRYLSMVNLRADPSGPVAARLATALGADLPVAPNTVATSPTGSVLWLGPDEWLVVGPVGDGGARVAERLRDALGGERGSAVDVSANRTTVEVRGPHARDVLEGGCPIDLHPRAFGPDRCAQTLLARIQVLLWQTAADPVYRLLVRPSFAAYLAAWLTDAATEFLEDPLVPG
jgi:sarcosine oxidase subunit gamma